MPSSEEGEIPAKKSREAIYYGDEGISDVILVVGNTDYHVHRNEGKVSIIIDEDQSGFSILMNMLYKQTYNDDDEEAFCPSLTVDQINDASVIKTITERWNWFFGDMRIANRFKVVDSIRPTLEREIVMIACGKSNCAVCATCNLAALFFNWERVLRRMKSSTDALVTTLTALANHPSTDLSVFHIAPAEFSRILDHVIGLSRGSRTDLPEKEEETEKKEEIRVFKYGQSDGALSDVTLVVKNWHFEFLAVHSRVFNALFFHDFKESTEVKVQLEEDPTALKGVLDLLYYGDIKGDPIFLPCELFTKTYPQITRFWKLLPAVAKLFDQFDLPLRLIEDPLLTRCPAGVNCIECASKKLFAIHFDLEKVKERIPSEPRAIATVLRKFNHIMPVPFHITPVEFCEIIKETKEMTSNGV